MLTFEVGDDAAVRLSFHNGAASRVGRPASSISTVPCICPQAQIAAMRSAAPSTAPSASRIERGDAGPPVERPLLSPAELRHDLIVLARRDMEDRAGPIDERGADAAGADIDGKGQVAGHSLSA